MPDLNDYLQGGAKAGTREPLEGVIDDLPVRVVKSDSDQIQAAILEMNAARRNVLSLIGRAARARNPGRDAGNHIGLLMTSTASGDFDLLADLLVDISDGSTVPAIKILRWWTASVLHTPMGLRESKEHIDAALLRRRERLAEEES